MGLLRRDPDRPGALERGRMRRRLRRQSQVREALLLDLGALVFELHRLGRREPELLQAKAAELMTVDEEVRALDDALGTGATVMQLTAAGIAGSCSQCAAIMPLDARYCASCGAPAQVALSSGPVAERAARLDAPAEMPPLPPRDDEPPDEIPTEERAALEAGDFEQSEPGPPVGEEDETFVQQPHWEAEEPLWEAEEQPWEDEEQPHWEDEEQPHWEAEEPSLDGEEPPWEHDEPLAPPVPGALTNGGEEAAEEGRGRLWRRRHG